MNDSIRTCGSSCEKIINFKLNNYLERRFSSMDLLTESLNELRPKFIFLLIDIIQITAILTKEKSIFYCLPTLTANKTNE